MVAARTETVVYFSGGTAFGAPHAKARLILPDLEFAVCDPRRHHDDMLDLAVNAIAREDDLRALCGSEEHVLALAKTIERQDIAATAAGERIQELEAQLAAALTRPSSAARALATSPSSADLTAQLNDQIRSYDDEDTKVDHQHDLLPPAALVDRLYGVGGGR